MADVRLLIQEEGRAARNLVAFNVPVGTNNVEKITRKPPSVPRVTQLASTKRSMKPTTRVRSASTGRDKKSGRLAFSVRIIKRQKSLLASSVFSIVVLLFLLPILIITL